MCEGIRFCRDDKSGYYKSSQFDPPDSAHRHVWRTHHGAILDGMHVHHKDGDKSNNDISNLELMSAADHLSYHQKKMLAEDPQRLQWLRDNLTQNARPKASEWHGSPEGIAWHRKHAQNSICLVEARDFVCDQCKKDFTAKPTGGNRFCSNACKSKWRRAAGLDDVKKPCIECGQDFTSNKYSRSKTCSTACANRVWHREKGHMPRPPRRLQHGS